MKKFVFVALPSTELERPPAAAGALYPIIKNAGYEPIVRDFNLHLFNAVSTEVFQHLENVWRGKSPTIDTEQREIFNKILEDYVKEIASLDPDFVGVSVFSRFSVTPAEEFLIALRHKAKYKGKVVLGGPGITAENKKVNKTAIGQNLSFAERTRQEGLCNYYVEGDGEHALTELLKGNTLYPGINGLLPHIQIDDLSSLPVSDYSATPPAEYYPSHEPGIYITASRGCIRNCSFCNISEIWPKFKMRTPEHIVEEIKHNAEKGAKVFHFTDSLINGDLRKWRKINEELAKLREDEKYKDVHYLGQFVCRPKSQQTEEDWYWYAKGGAGILVCGIESFSPKVRKSMGKNYTNEDIDFHFEQCAKYGIKTIVLMFVGYPNETLEDHEMNKEFLRRYKKYADAGIIHMIRWGYTGMFSTLDKINSDDIDLVVDKEFQEKFENLPLGLKSIALGFSWINKKNPNLNLKERLRRRLELHKLSVELGWPQTRSEEELRLLLSILRFLKDPNAVIDQSLSSLEDKHD